MNVEIYSRTNCGYCDRAKIRLQKYNPKIRMLDHDYTREDFLIESDVGVTAASEIKKIISTEKIDPKNETLAEVNLILKNYIYFIHYIFFRINFFLSDYIPYF